MLRPVYFALWAPNGAGRRPRGVDRPDAGAARDSFVEPARLLLAAPYVLFLFRPSLGLLGGDACAMAALSLAVTTSPILGLRRSRQGRAVDVVALGAQAVDLGGSEVGAPVPTYPT